MTKYELGLARLISICLQLHPGRLRRGLCGGRVSSCMARWNAPGALGSHRSGAGGVLITPTSHNFSGLTAFMHVYNHVYNLYMTCLYMLHYVTPCDTACENSTNVSIQYHDDHELQIAFSQYFLHFFGVFLMLKVTLVMFGPNMSKLKGKLE